MAAWASPVTLLSPPPSLGLQAPVSFHGFDMTAGDADTDLMLGLGAANTA